MEAWINAGAQSNSGSVVAIKLQSTTNNLTAYGLLRCCAQMSTALDFHTNFNNSVTSQDSPVDNTILSSTWHHLAGTFNGADLCLYVDGALFGCNNTSIGALSTGAGPLILCGSDGATGNFNGLVDEVHVYARELTASEIRAHFLNP
jgi:hypothetical protein